jgi:valyl-tRNA synthetase
VTEVDALYEHYEFAKITDVLYHFAWDEVCDWYIELAKLSLDGVEAAATRRVLGEVLDTLLRLLHPMVPFVTEALWTRLTGGESLVVAEWPRANTSHADPGAEEYVDALQAVVTEVRRFRSDQGVKPSARIPAAVRTGVDEDDVRALCRLAASGDRFAVTASLPLAGGGEIAFDLSGEIDVAAERARLQKDLAAAQRERQANETKLANPEFTGKAPQPVVEKVRDRLAVAQADIARIEAALAALPAA